MYKKKSEPSLLVGWGAAITLIGILMCCMCATKKQQDTEEARFKPRPLSERLNMINRWHESLKQEKLYTEQQQFWDIVMGASWLHVQSKATYRQPVIIALAGYNKNHLVTRSADIAIRYAEVFNLGPKSYATFINGDEYKNKSADEAKLDIDNVLSAGFASGLKVAVITNLDKIPPCSVMLFHSYCDGDNAPYKDTVIIFTIVLTQTGAGDSSISDELHKHMAKVWATCPSELSPSKIVAMQSRLLNNVAHVK